MTEPPRRPAGQWTPAELGVHQVAGGGPMPAYIRRPHDERLRAVLDPETEYSRLVVVRGDALTGTSRTVYEAVTDMLADWALEDLPTAAALAARLEAGISPRTVLWLGELRHHADADGGAAILDRLDDVLEDVGPLVAIATIWPGYWDSYTAAAAAGFGGADPAAMVGRLLAPLDVLAEYDPAHHDPAYGGVLDVPARFTPAEITAAADAGDPALAAAAAAASTDGQVTQYLAGVRDALARYGGPGADPYGQALITAAMDAGRLGHAGPLPAAVLRDAAVGYLSHPHQPAVRADRWDTALAWATDSGWALQPVPPAAGHGTVGYRVTGYLYQHGLRTRADRLGPATLWDALAAHASSTGDLGRLAQAAQDRGLYRHAATLWTAAAAAGRTDAAARLITHLGAVAEPAESARAARWAVGRAGLDDPWDVARLLAALRAAGAGDALQALLARDPAGQVSLSHQWDVTRLLDGLYAAGAADAIRTLAARAVEMVDIEEPYGVAGLLTALLAVGADAEVRALLARDPGRHVSLERTGGVAELLEVLLAAGAGDAVRVLAVRAADDVSLEDGEYVARLLHVLRTVGAGDAIQVLLARDPARQVRLMFPQDVARLLEALHAAGAGDAVQVLLARDPGRHAAIDASQPFRPGYQLAFARLLAALREVGAADAVQVLAARAADAGMFGLFLEARTDEAAVYRFGREPDGTPSPPWSWSEPAPT